MLIRRTAIWLLTLGALVSMAGRAVAQPAHSGVPYQTPTPNWENGSAPFAEDGSDTGHPIIEPFKPVGFEPEFDWFAPAQTSSYGRGQKANIGAFMSYERLYWSIASPEKGYIGSENVTFDPFFDNTFFPDGPSVDNRFITAHGAWGNRWELGYIDTDDYGWLVSVIDHVSQGSYRVDQNPAITFLDPNGITDGFVTVGVKDTDPKQFVVIDVGPTPAIAAQLQMKNLTQLNGVELSRFYRARRLHNGGYFELIYGARWFQINDTFMAIATGNGTGGETFTTSSTAFLDSATATFTRNIFDASTWSLRANNNLIGPQIGVRFFRQRQRFTTSLAARFLAAANFQNLQLKSVLGTNTAANQAAVNSNYRTSFRGLGSDIQEYTTTFAPMGELRVDVSYNLTRAVALKVGYTGIVVGNMSRASNSIDYDAVNLIGIKRNTDQIFFTNGLNFGVEVNR